MNLREEWTKAAVDSIAAETERWCEKALAESPDNRVWRSDALWEGDAVTGRKLTHHFQILTPGQPAPGSGMVFGPFHSLAPRHPALDGTKPHA